VTFFRQFSYEIAILRMKWHHLTSITMVVLASSSLAFATNRDVIRLQVQVRDMNDQAMILQQSLDEDFGAITESLKQTTAQLTANESRLDKLQQIVQETSEGTRTASLSLQLATLTQSTSDVGIQLQHIGSHVQALGAEIGHPIQTTAVAGQAPPPDVLFRSGIGDYEAGRYKLAGQEFAEYVKFYSATDQAGQAQYYLADSEYWSGDYDGALNDFDKLEQQYPQTDEASVELKRGLSLARLGTWTTPVMSSCA
jgi:TolA-binding protein